MLTLAPSVKVYLACGPTDMRKSFDTLAGLVREEIEEDPLSGHVFAFCSRRRHLVKILYWDGTGFWLLAKRLARGTFAWPEAETEQTTRELRLDELSAILSGIDLARTTWKSWWRKPGGALPPPPALAR